jgi:hypothetical protein
MTFNEHATSSAHREPESPDEPSNGTTPASQTRRRRLLMSAAVALTAIAGVTVAHAASAAAGKAAEGKPAAQIPQPTASASEEALWRRQELLSDLRTWIEEQPGIKTSGYVTSINDPDAGSTILVWHGPPDPMQQQILDEARRRNIPASVQQRKHSMNDLERASRQLMAIESGTGVLENFTINSAGIFDIDFDGVIVSGDYIQPPAEGIAAADTALAQALTAKTGVAVTIEHNLAEPA